MGKGEFHLHPDPCNNAIRTRQEREVSREAWTATVQFVFMPVIPADLVVFNPMGIQITYLETDRTLITETP